MTSPSGISGSLPLCVGRVQYTCDGKTIAFPIDTNHDDIILPGRPTLQSTVNWEGILGKPLEMLIQTVQDD